MSTGDPPTKGVELNKKQYFDLLASMKKAYEEAEKAYEMLKQIGQGAYGGKG